MMSNLSTYYKVLDYDGSCYHGGRGKWKIGQRRSVHGALVSCKNAIHACTLDQLMMWLGPAINTIELEDVQTDYDKVYARAGTLGPRFETWNVKTVQQFAADCAEHVLPIFEVIFSRDDRPRLAIAAVREYARTLDQVALDAARDAVRLAAIAAGFAERVEPGHGASLAASAVHAATPASRGSRLDWGVVGGMTSTSDRARRAVEESGGDEEVELAWQTGRLRQYLAGEVLT